MVILEEFGEFINLTGFLPVLVPEVETLFLLGCDAHDWYSLTLWGENIFKDTKIFEKFNSG